MGLGFEDGRRMAGLDHVLDHAVDAQAQFLDIAPLVEPVDEARVAAVVLLDDVVHRDVRRQTAGAGDLHAVGVHADLDAAPGQPVVAVGDGIDQRLAHGRGGILGLFLALQAAHDGSACPSLPRSRARRGR